jgi:uncharacterized protein YjiS (DUF1127 family)
VTPHRSSAALRHTHGGLPRLSIVHRAQRTDLPDVQSDTINKPMEPIMAVMTSFRRYTSYVRTVRELRDLPQDLAFDLGIDRADARKIAHKAVYGF